MHEGEQISVYLIMSSAGALSLVVCMIPVRKKQTLQIKMKISYKCQCIHTFSLHSQPESTETNNWKVHK